MVCERGRRGKANLKSYPLHPSPIARLRTKYRVCQADAAARLGLSLGQLRVLEMRTSELPSDVLDVIDVLLAPPARFVQITIWDALADLERRARSVQGEGAQHA